MLLPPRSFPRRDTSSRGAALLSFCHVGSCSLALQIRILPWSTLLVPNAVCVFTVAFSDPWTRQVSLGYDPWTYIFLTPAIPRCPVNISWTVNCWTLQDSGLL